MKNKFQSILITNFTFVIFMIYSVIASITIVSFTTDYNFILPLTPFVLTLPPVLITYFITKQKSSTFSNFFALNKTNLKDYLVAISLAVLGYIPFNLMNNAWITILPKRDFSSTYEGIAQGISFPLLFLSFVILPAIIEELAFRGLFFEFLKNKKPWIRIFTTSLLFTLFHLDPYNLFLPFLMGMFLGLLREKTGSIFPSMWMHGVSNFTGLLLMKIGTDNINNAPSYILGLILIISFTAFVYIAYKVFKTQKEDAIQKNDSVLTYELLDAPVQKLKKESFLSYLPLSIPVLLIVFTTYLNYLQ